MRPLSDLLHWKRHEHTVECGPAYFAERGYGARLRHPKAWSRVVRDQRQCTLVVHGQDSPQIKRLRWLGLARHIASLTVLYFAVVAVPEWLEGLAWALLMLPALLYLWPSAYRDVLAARNYRDGWIEGRQQLLKNSIYDAIEVEPDSQPGQMRGTVDMDRVMAGIAYETTRDMEVVLNHRTSTVPDDLSGLEDR